MVMLSRTLFSSESALQTKYVAQLSALIFSIIGTRLSMVFQ